VNDGERWQLPDGRWATLVREVRVDGVVLEVAYWIDGEADEHRVYFTPERVPDDPAPGP
jgi:hypothetical protein